MRKFFDKIKGYLMKIKVNKYYVTIIIFLVLMFCIGDSTLQKRYSYDRQINSLEKEIEYYKKQKEENTQKLNALQSDEESLEKFAREQFLMTKPNEELFIIIP